MICLDTHAWYWLTVDSPRLPARLKRQLAAEELVISTTSIWELAFLIEEGRLRVQPGLAASWMQRSSSMACGWRK